MKNIWLKFRKARKIADFLQKKYFNKPYGTADNCLEFQILEDMWNHPLYEKDMSLNIFWDDRERLLWLQVGPIEGLVPR